MSLYKKTILSKGEVVVTNDVVFMDGKRSGTKDNYIDRMVKEEREALKEELKKIREEEMEKVYREVESIKEQAYQEGKLTAEEEAIDKVKQRMKDKLEEDYEAEMEKIRSEYYKAKHYALEEERKIREKKEQWIRDNEKQIIEIIMVTIEKIIGKSVQIESETLKGMLNQSLEEVTEHHNNVWVKVHPDTKEMLESGGFSEKRVELIADPDLQKLDFLIESEGEGIDSTLQTKLDRTKEILEEWVSEKWAA